MKKALLGSLAAILALAGCNGKGGQTTASQSEDYRSVYSLDMRSLDYTVSNRAVDNEKTANFVDGLLENDKYGNYVPALAESYESNDDKTEWTFKIRKGVKWVTNEGEEYAELKAQDFVTGLQHAADFKSRNAGLVEGLIKNFSEYELGEVTFDKVGVEAIDDYTLKYTLEKPVYYFYSLATYGILFPINEDFLNSKGPGCKLGSPDLNACDFGIVDPSSILYNGGYILTNNTAKSIIEFTKNQNYWDAEHVYINKVTYTYDDGSDDHSVMNGFEAGTYTSASIRGTWSTDEFNAYMEKYKDNVYLPMTDNGIFSLSFNYNRRSFNNTSKTTDAEKENTHKAILNKNFRLAFQAAFNRVPYLMQSVGDETTAKTLLRNELVPTNLVQIDGEDYGKTVAKFVTEQTDVFGSSLDLSAGQDPYYNPDKAKELLAKAASEAGLTLPVSLDLVVNSTMSFAVNQANSLKKSVEEATNGQILINVMPIDKDSYYAATYLVESGQESDWDISTAVGWNPDYIDPRSYLNAYSPVNGEMLITVGLNGTSDDDNFEESDKASMEALNLAEYGELDKAADTITDNLDERYTAFAKVDAWNIANAFLIPVHCTTVLNTVSRVIPFTGPYSEAGQGGSKFKFIRIQKEITTNKDYYEAKEAWLAERAKNTSK